MTAWLALRIRMIGLVVLLLSISGPLAYGFYHQLYLNGVQAEARLMFSYLHTLQKVYKLERGNFATFTHYGAPLLGQDHCEQPLGAAQLGFLLHGCHDETAAPPRYVYQSREIDSGYILEAQSGSDGLGRSLVCFNPSSAEQLVSLPNSDVQTNESCW